MTGCVVSWKWRGGVLAGRGVAAADVAALQAAAQRHPPRALDHAGLAERRGVLVDRGVPHPGPRTSDPNRLRTWFSRWMSSRSALATSSIDSSTSSIASTSATTSDGTVPGLPDLEDPRPLGVDHRAPDPAVEVARRLLVGGGGQPLPGGEVPLVDPLPDQVDDAVRVLELHLVEGLEAGLGRLLEQGGAGQRVVERVGPGHVEPPGQPRQGEALQEQRAGHDGERDQQQDLAVRERRRG